MQTALGDIVQFVARIPPITYALVAALVLFAAWQRFSKTERYLRWRVRRNPYDAEAHCELGDALSERAPQEAETEFREAIALNPWILNAHFALARLQLARPERLLGVEPTVKRMLELFPDHAIAHVLEGRVLKLKGCYAEAEAAYRKAIELGPRLWLPYFMLALLLENDLQRDEEAEAAYRQAIKNGPSISGNYANLGALLARTDRDQEAIQCYRKAIKRNPKHGPSYTNLGLVLMATMRPAKAKRMARKAVKLGVRSVPEELSLARLLRGVKWFAEEEQAYRRAIAKDAECTSAYSNLGLLLDEQPGRAGEAEAIYQQGLSVAPDDSNLNYNLSHVLRRERREAEAMPVLRRTIAIEPESCVLYMALAACERVCGDHEAYTENIEKARSLMPADDYYDLACLESLCENYELALEHLRKAAQQSDFDAAWAWRDPDLECLRADPRFAEIAGPPPEF